MAEQPALSFAALLRQLRTEAKLTQEELAEAAGISPRSVSDLERGINRTARKDTAMQLADALGLTGRTGELFVAAARGRAPAAEVLTAAHDNLTGHPPGLARLTGVGVDSPYRGLSMFEEQDAAFFFGREAAASQLLERMSRLSTGQGLLVVSGVSGAGKSSLLRAGVLPRIRAAGLTAAPGSQSWPRLVFTPTRAPLDELALRVAVLARADAAGVRRGLDADPAGFALTARQAALTHRRPAEDIKGPTADRDHQSLQRRLLVVVDQFEELFTQCADEAQRRTFITALHAAAAVGHGPDQAAALVVLGVRADFEARCADYPQLADAVQDRYLVTAMTERQLRMAITEPAKKAGSKVDDDLVGILLTEVRNDQPGAFGAGVLPLLSHALDQAWRSRTGETVTLADYERAGGIDGAVAESAQRAYDHLTPAQQSAARQIFTRLAATGSEGIDSAGRATRTDLTEGKTADDAQNVEEVLEAFAAERLLTLATDTVELSHEVLLTAWPLLRDTWLADTHADQIVRTRLHATAAEWARHSRDPSYLYTGSLLHTATSTAARVSADPAHHPPLSQTERDFLHASNNARRRQTRRRQAFLTVVIALVGFASATVVAIRADQQVAHERDVAVSGQLTFESRFLGRTNNKDRKLSTLLSIAAWQINPSGDSRDAMLAAAALWGIAAPGPTWPAVRVSSVAFSPDGTMLATGGADGIHLWNVSKQRPSGGPLTGRGGNVSSVAFSPDGTMLASGGADGIRLWRVATGLQIGNPLTIPDHPATPVTSLAFSPDGNTLLGGSSIGIRLWDVRTGLARLSPLTARGGNVSSVAFSPGGTMLATGGADGIRLWNVTTGRQIRSPLASRGGKVLSVAFSPRGGILADVSSDGIRLWDAATRYMIGPLHTASAGQVVSIAFSPGGNTLASASADGAIQLWNVAITTDLVPYLCRHAGRSLTHVQWAQYLPQGPAYHKICP